MSTRALPRSTRTAAATTRAITRASLAGLSAALFAAAMLVGEIELITAALLTGVAGIAVDVRQTDHLSRVRAEL